MAEFTEEQLGDMAWRNESPLRQIEETLVEHGRWSVLYRTVFLDTDTGKYHVWLDSRPATEYQAAGYEKYPEELVECPEVRPVEKLVTVYEKGE